MWHLFALPNEAGYLEERREEGETRTGLLQSWKRQTEPVVHTWGYQLWTGNDLEIWGMHLGEGGV